MLFAVYNGVKTKKYVRKQRKKSDLPQKKCAQCARPFSWRKKWEKVWEEVKFCSDKCRKESKGKKTEVYE